MTSELLLVTPCDPGNCHIYFGVQLRALPTALALASKLRRTLVLPPFEWYDDQAQQFANAFRATASGRLPHFTPWSSLFDIEALRSAGANVIDLADAFTAMQTIDRAILQTGNVLPRGKELAQDDVQAAEVYDPLKGVMASNPCRAGRDGLQANLTWVDTHKAMGASELYGQSFAFRHPLRCGTISLTDDTNVLALDEWLAGVRVAAVFNVGHHLHTKVNAPQSRALIEHSLHPNPSLDKEAERFVAERIAPQEFVAVHWRHGDYVAYKLLTPLETLVQRVIQLLRKIECRTDEDEDGASLASCQVFLMTNCRNSSALEEFRAAMPPATNVVRYEPTQPFHRTEGGRLVIEQAIAARAHAFLPSQRSAVSEYVETLRRQRQRAAAKLRSGPAQGGKAEL